MKKFEKPEIEVKEIEVLDVVTTSCPDDCWDDGTECPEFTGWG